MKKIKEFPDYYITKNGNIYSIAPRANRGRPIKPVKLKPYKQHGYWAIDLQKNGRCYKKYIHRLILEAFVGLSPKGYQCRHLNGLKTDNRLSNLKWGTRAENQQDRELHGTGNQGESHGMNKHNKKFVLKVRNLCKKYTQKDIAVMLKISQSTVSWLNTRGWKHLK